ncbi:MAG TPA: hypothetical protein VFB41_06350 [Solirubrobacteraceae bacterium]|nr:hypothetical protein [Solirubrobacteraceae bacterium]
MFETAPFISSIFNLRADDADLADTRLVALVNEARTQDEQFAIGRSARERLRLVRRRS